MRFLFLFFLLLLPSCQPRNQVSSGPTHAAASFKKAPIAYNNTSSRHVDTSTASKSSDPEKMNFVICLDAGHGGYDSGTRRKKTPILCEKYVALDLTIALQKALIPLGYKVILTRDSDQFISLPDRVLLARKNKAILFVSLHFNWAKNTACRGIEIFYFEKKNDLRSSLSKKAAELCIRHITSAIPLPSRGVKHGNFYVVRETPMPAVLIESGFFSNSEDVLFLKQKANRNKLALVIAKGIDEFCRLER